MTEGEIHDCARCHDRPGSATAAQKGCICPVLDNGRGHADPRWMVVRLDCPLHSQTVEATR